MKRKTADAALRGKLRIFDLFILFVFEAFAFAALKRNADDAGRRRFGRFILKLTFLERGSFVHSWLI